MKLKRHREDVKDLKLQQDAHVQAIAKRYQRLILMAEDSIDMHPYDEKTYRVLKDAEE